MHLQTNSSDSKSEESPPRREELSALVNSWIAAFNAHDVERIVTLYAEDAELFDTGMRHVRKGHNEIRSWFTQRFRQMPTIQYTPTQRFFNERGGNLLALSGTYPPCTATTLALTSVPGRRC